VLGLDIRAPEIHIEPDHLQAVVPQYLLQAERVAAIKERFPGEVWRKVWGEHRLPLTPSILAHSSTRYSSLRVPRGWPSLPGNSQPERLSPRYFRSSLVASLPIGTRRSLLPFPSTLAAAVPFLKWMHSTPEPGQLRYPESAIQGE